MSDSGLRRITRPSAWGRLASVTVLVCAVAILACSESEYSSSSSEMVPLPPEQSTRVVTQASAQPAPLTGERFTEEDWEILRGTVQWSVENGLDTLPLGETVATLGRHFVGWPYTPGTLEAPGPERVVINLREFDCVTFVENVLALTAFVRTHGIVLLEDRQAAEEAYRGYLAALRYRDGEPGEYEHRLHYFSEWLADNARRGHLHLLDDELGAVADPEAIDFMSAHPDAYRQLAVPGVKAAIARIEGTLNAGTPRRYLPEDRLEGIDAVLRPGDVIAATSTLPGLDVAHTGIAVEVGGRIHLLHAPLVGDSVEVSTRPLADRIVALTTQDGIMAARPRPGAFFGSDSR